MRLRQAVSSPQGLLQDVEEEGGRVQTNELVGRQLPGAAALKEARVLQGVLRVTGGMEAKCV